MAETSEQDRQRDEAGREAIRRLSCPVKGRVMLAQAFTVLSALLSFAPYLALVWLGDLFLAGEGPLAQADASKVHEIALLLVMAFLSQLFFRALALIITHFADMKLRYVIRKGIVERLSRAPLAWFSATESGKVRSAVQDDTKTVHTVIAHGTVIGKVSPHIVRFYPTLDKITAFHERSLSWRHQYNINYKEKNSTAIGGRKPCAPCGPSASKS